jgi:hypothetical protein
MSTTTIAFLKKNFLLPRTREIRGRALLVFKLHQHEDLYLFLLEGLTLGS